ESPVMLPPGLAKLATKPLPTGSIATAKTIGMAVVTCTTVGTALPTVTITSTFKRTNSAAISTYRSVRQSDQRYSIAMVRFSIQPNSRRCATKAAVHGLKAEASAPRKPIVGSFPACCARAAIGQATAPPSSVTNSRRLVSDIGLPPALAPAVGLPQAQPAAEGPPSPWDRPELF